MILKDNNYHYCLHNYYIAVLLRQPEGCHHLPHTPQTYIVIIGVGPAEEEQTRVITTIITLVCACACACACRWQGYGDKALS